jgi:transcriptional regulator with XRE-family HTH domain
MKTKRSPILARFGLSVYVRRKALHLTQTTLAKKSRIHRTYVADVESGTRNPSLKTIVRLARALKVSVKQLVRDI